MLIKFLAFSTACVIVTIAMAQGTPQEMCQKEMRQFGGYSKVPSDFMSNCLVEAGAKSGKLMMRPEVLTAKKADMRIDAATRAIKSVLNDPTSAQFKNLKYHPESGAVCGMFNAKNAMGGYSDFRAFAYSADGQLIDTNGLSPTPTGNAALDHIQKTENALVATSMAGALCGDL